MDMEAEGVGEAAWCGQEAPLLERYGSGWICRKRDSGEIIPNFDGVAFCVELDRFVHTYQSGGERGMWELGSRSIEGALAESEELKRQMTLDL